MRERKRENERERKREREEERREDEKEKEENEKRISGKQPTLNLCTFRAVIFFLFLRKLRLATKTQTHLSFAVGKKFFFSLFWAIRSKKVFSLSFKYCVSVALRAYDLWTWSYQCEEEEKRKRKRKGEEKEKEKKEKRKRKRRRAASQFIAPVSTRVKDKNSATKNQCSGFFVVVEKVLKIVFFG